MPPECPDKGCRVHVTPSGSSPALASGVCFLWQGSAWSSRVPRRSGRQWRKSSQVQVQEVCGMGAQLTEGLGRDMVGVVDESWGKGRRAGRRSGLQAPFIPHHPKPWCYCSTEVCSTGSPQDAAAALGSGRTGCGTRCPGADAGLTLPCAILQCCWGDQLVLCPSYPSMKRCSSSRPQTCLSAGYVRGQPIQPSLQSCSLPRALWLGSSVLCSSFPLLLPSLSQALCDPFPSQLTCWLFSQGTGAPSFTLPVLFSAEEDPSNSAQAGPDCSASLPLWAPPAPAAAAGRAGPGSRHCSV